jgi:hypothetical protein
VTGKRQENHWLCTYGDGFGLSFCFSCTFLNWIEEPSRRTRGHDETGAGPPSWSVVRVPVQ